MKGSTLMRLEMIFLITISSVFLALFIYILAMTVNDYQNAYGTDALNILTVQGRKDIALMYSFLLAFTLTCIGCAYIIKRAAEKLKEARQLAKQGQ